MTQRKLSSEYQSYIQSQAWREIAEKRKAIDGYKCYECGSEDNLQVHHITYERLGHENIESDLITLCETCHKERHWVKTNTITCIMAGILLSKIAHTEKGIKGFLESIGIIEVADWAISRWEQSAGILYIEIPSGGAITVPFMNAIGWAEKDMRKMCEYLQEEFFTLDLVSHKLNAMAMCNPIEFRLTGRFC